ncbi:hypothetical protein SMACR_09540 [Sordaria macrospora]|uniref:WGS project CABT00000000 data, contig 2.98 n=2 Tax=Sordaria macrospora TaxID=5147 RepID=F7WC64_SORMK|nr:uncharacterized protein SMAC_09540 [Sordaria macrospora k-hell]KAA8633973.1 hypothetical protein SMACR_09540 [Sordaria macrospora]WPJ66196.1 hypothetical protein SMAC4_09540 [Sordaria macrospora]CCC05554.1 unnamed protein product [Sordaria macrospora k-hell]
MASSIITRSLLFSSLWSSLSSALILPTSSPQTDILSARSKPPKLQSSWNIMGALFPCVFIIIAVYFLVEHCYVRANRGFDQVESPQWTSSQLGEDGPEYQVVWLSDLLGVMVTSDREIVGMARRQPPEEEESSSGITTTTSTSSASSNAVPVPPRLYAL